MKARTMVYLEPEQLQALKARARAQRISLAELMRRLVRDHLKSRPEPPPLPAKVFRRIVALGSSGRRDISERHDEYLAEAIRRQHAR